MNPVTSVFDQYAQDYDRWFDTHKETFDNQLALLRPRIPRKGIGLEIGIGSGRFSAPLGIHYGLDPSVSLLSMARQRGVESVVGTGESLPYRSGTFDHVLMMTVICFFTHLNCPFSEANRVLVPGGTLVIGFFDKEGELAQQEQERDPPGRFLQNAMFRTADEVKDALVASGFSGFMFIENHQGFSIAVARKTG
ncbi:MAG: class I SAM-dependent methyltransferase [Methanoregula sp.]|nr:class I SAM-dependent methyltransferase [Methanoregula sp.]